MSRCRRLLDEVPAPADRMSLLRTLAWLQGGRADLAGLKIGPQEPGLLDRFGLRAAGTGETVRLVGEEVPDWWPGSLNVDTSDRRPLRAGSADAVLLRLTANRSYRSYAQKAAVRSMLTQPGGSGLMASMPTGAGKSLLFQLAALHGRTAHPGSCVVVITPTVALALDHERSMRSMPGLEASRALTGDQPRDAAREVIDSFRRGEVPVLLLGPEAALREDVAGYLMEAASPAPSAFGLEARLTHVFVDEAHIVESWGRSFRPDFQRLPGLLARLRSVEPDMRLVLLSATLSPSARRVLRDGWSLGGEWLEVEARVPRYEHDVVVKGFASADDRLEALGWTVDRVPRPTIIYTTEVDHAKEVHRWLVAERGYARARLFTGETSSAERREVVEGWARDDIDLVVATSAFGMGVDKADVRSVIHACLPEGPSRWYQEIGRAARDGGQGVAALLFTDRHDRDDDVHRAMGMATGGWLTRDLAERRWKAMVEQARSKGWEDGRFVMTLDLDSVRDGLRPQSSDYNRSWNRTLLTLLQRSGALEVVSVDSRGDEVGDVWKVRLTNTELLQSAPAAWDMVFNRREAEVRGAKDELAPFVRLVQRPTRSCVTRGAFELIEPDSYAPPCGRCPACRAEGVRPPMDLRCGGLEAAWPEPSFYAGPLPPGVVIVDPRDRSLERGLAGLLKALVAVGMEQFVVPNDMAARVAGLLRYLPCRLGLVLSLGEWSDDALPARTPAALLLPQDLADVEEPARRFAAWSLGRAVPSVVVTDGARVVGGRRLDQWLSRHAPIKEAGLAGEAPFAEVAA